MLLWGPKSASNSRNCSSDVSKFGCALAYFQVIRANRSMLSVRISTAPVDVGLKYPTRVISIAVGKMTEVLAQFVVFDITVE